MINDIVYDEFEAEQINIILKSALITLKNDNLLAKLAKELNIDEADLEDLSEQIENILEEC